MSERSHYRNLPDEESLFALGQDQLWYRAAEITPELSVDGEELLMSLSLTGHDLPDHCWVKRSAKLSKLVLTVGRYDHPPYGAHYEIGFYDGEMFRGSHGYRIYPDPTHWIPLPKPPLK